VRIVLSIICVVGTFWITYVLLSPSVWSPATFDMYPGLAAIAIGTSLANEIPMARSKAPAQMTLTRWSLTVFIASVTIAAMGLALSVAFLNGGAKQNLVSTTQQAVFAGACVIAAIGGFWLSNHVKRLSRLLDREREERLAAARDAAHRNVADFVTRLDTKSAPERDHPQGS
jgi:hypothetical protein